MTKHLIWACAGALALYAGAGAALAAEPATAGSRAAEAAARQAHADAQVRDVRIVRLRHGGPEQSESRLRNLLQLRADQEPALKAYLAALEPTADRFMRFDAETPARSTPERLAAMEAQVAAREAEVRSRIQAVRTFYAALDPAQRRAFDELPLMLHDGFGPMVHGPMALGPMPIAHPMPPLPPLPPLPPEGGVFEYRMEIPDAG